MVEKGINTIGGLIDAEGEIFTNKDIRIRLELECIFLLYTCILKIIQKSFHTKYVFLLENYIKQHPHLPYVLHVLDIGTKGNNNV